MDGVMATCRDNPQLGRIGCGATYGGEMQHSVAKVPWSRHTDGIAHITGRLNVIDLCWAKGRNGQIADPSTIDGLEQDSRGVWRKPLSAEAQARLRPGAGVSIPDLSPSNAQEGP